MMGGGIQEGKGGRGVIQSWILAFCISLLTCCCRSRFSASVSLERSRLGWEREEGSIALGLLGFWSFWDRGIRSFFAAASAPRDSSAAWRV